MASMSHLTSPDRKLPIPGDRERSPALRLAFVQSSWHEEIVDRARDAFLEEIATLGVPRDQIDLFGVPGAFEIPLHAQRLAAQRAATRPSSGPGSSSTAASTATSSWPKPSSTASCGCSSTPTRP